MVDNNNQDGWLSRLFGWGSYSASEPVSSAQRRLGSQTMADGAFTGGVGIFGTINNLFAGFFKFFSNIGEAFSMLSEGKSLREVANHFVATNQQLDEELNAAERNLDGPTNPDLAPLQVSDDPTTNAAVSAVSAAALGGVGYIAGKKAVGSVVKRAKGVASTVAKKVSGEMPAIKSALGSSDEGYKVLQEGQLADDALKTAAKKEGFFAKLVSKLPKKGKMAIIGAGAATGLAVYNLLGSSEAQGAVPPTGEPNNPDQGNTRILPTDAPVADGAEETSMDSVVAGVGAATAAKALGMKAIPVLGAVMEGYDTLDETISYMWEGEFSKAGVAFVAGAGQTAAATGGILTYSLGSVWHAAVRDGSMYAFGDDVEIEKSDLRQLGEAGVEYISSAFSDASAAPDVKAAQNLVRNSEIVVGGPSALRPEFSALAGQQQGFVHPDDHHNTAVEVAPGIFLDRSALTMQ